MSDEASKRAAEDQAYQPKNLPPLQKRVIDKISRRLIVFIFILFLFTILDRINIGFAGLTIGRDIGLTATEFGLAASLFYIAYAVCGVPNNMALARIGAKIWMGLIMILWGFASTATMFAEGPKSLYALRILVGICEAGFLPGVLVYLTYWFPAHFRARANALFIFAMPVTIGIGSAVSGYILEMDGVLYLHGWQWLFFLEGFPCVILGVLVWIILDESPDNARWLTEEEKQCLKEMMESDSLVLVQKEGPQAMEAVEPHSLRSDSFLRQVFTPIVLLYTLAYFFLCNSVSCIVVWNPLIIKSMAEENTPNHIIGLLAAIPQVCTIILMVYWGRRSDNKAERKFHTWFPYIISAAGWVMAAIPGQPEVQFAGICLASAGTYTAMAIFWTTPDQSISEKARAVGIAVTNAIGNLGLASGPFIVGWMYDMFHSYEMGLYSLAVLLAVGAVTVMMIPMRQSRPSALP